jgi:DNA-binding CsgD family transcriptional regulator
MRGDYGRSEAFAAEALDRSADRSSWWFRVEVENMLALTRREQGHHDEAMDLAIDSLRLARISGNARGSNWAHYTTKLVERDRGVTWNDRQLAALEEFSRTCVGNGGLLEAASVCATIAAAHAELDHDAVASEWAVRSVDLADRVGVLMAMCFAMQAVVVVASRSGHAADGAQLHGALQPFDFVLRRTATAMDRAVYESAVSSSARALGQSMFDAARAEGEILGWERAVDLARRLSRDAAAALASSSVPLPQRRRRGPRANPELTEREREIVAQLVRGGTNQGIGDTLGISAKTVMHHTTSIYRKLGVRGRAEAVGYALRSGLVAS